MFGLMSVSKLAHNVESSLVENDSPLDDTQRVALVETWQRAAQRIHGLLGESYGDNIEIQREELRSVVAKARAGMSGHRLAALLEDWEHDPAQKRLEELARQGAKLARALGKPEPKFEIQGHHVRLDAATWSSFWSAMAHAVRNSMDHGIEDAETRVAAGKGEAGNIKLSANRSAGRLTICLTDDGRGIDWELLRSKLRQAGLPHREHGDLVAGLLADGITTREQVTDISGRGVGLAALRQAVEELNGSIKVESQAAHGTTFRFVFTDPPRPSTTPSSGDTHSSRVST
jgi:two-component system chemotaxis sensor kinase CheA